MIEMTDSLKGTSLYERIKQLEETEKKYNEILAIMNGSNVNAVGEDYLLKGSWKRLDLLTLPKVRKQYKKTNGKTKERRQKLLDFRSNHHNASIKGLYKELLPIYQTIQPLYQDINYLLKRRKITKKGKYNAIYNIVEKRE